MRHGTHYGYRKGCRTDQGCPSRPSCRAIHADAEYGRRTAEREVAGLTGVHKGPGSASQFLRRGSRAEFVSWTWIGDEQVPETKSGVYVGLTADDWVISVNGKAVNLPRSEWQVCIA